jgi:chromate transporter
MEQEVVRRRRWISSERFLDLLGAANLIPGPSSTELAIFVGYEKGGWFGLILGGVCFILPAALLVTALAWAYVQFGSLPKVSGIFYGIEPIVIAVIAQALWGLAPKAIKKSFWLGALGLMACVASANHADAAVVLLGSGMASMAERQVAKPGGAARAVLFAALARGGVPVAAPATGVALFAAFLKVGALVFGSGYVLLPFLRADLVERLHWLTERQLLDAVVIGQVTPGPVFTTATFIGYIIGGASGAVAATVGIFLPGFVLVAVTRPLLARVRESQLASAFLDGVNVAALALMAVVLVQLGRVALVDGTTVAMALGSVILLIRYRMNATWLVVAGAVVGAVVAACRT